MNLQWPEQMPASGRVTKEESDVAWGTGICRVMDPTMSCPQTLHITLFFDGTNNNDAEDNKLWRDSKKKTHTNVARLFNGRARPVTTEDGVTIQRSSARSPCTMYIAALEYDVPLMRAEALHPVPH
ncbi:hypothetical protein [Caballeronia sp.]|uniref:hypothetical protein n=1 Tax=Caballeronia sp. TaxID=1931223 RepID=UPI003C47BB34